MAQSTPVTNPLNPPHTGTLVRAIRALPDPLTYDDGRKALLAHVDYVRKQLPFIQLTNTQIKNVVREARANASKIEDYARRLIGGSYMGINERAQVIQNLGTLYGGISAYTGVSSVVIQAREEFAADVGKEALKVVKNVGDAALSAGKITLFFGALLPYLPLIAIAAGIALEIRYSFFSKLLGRKLKGIAG